MKGKKINHYNVNYHLFRHHRYINNKRFFHFCVEVANEKFWKFLEGKVLEVGCGTGQNICNKKNVIGIDVSEFAAKMAKKYVDSIILMDAEFLGFKDESFNSILCAHVLEHTENPLLVLKEFNRTLKKNGKLALTIPLKRYKSTDEDQHLYIWGPLEISNLLKRGGFRAVKLKEVSYRLKKFLCYLPFPLKLLLFLSKLAGALSLFLKPKTGPQELLIYAIKLKE